MPVTQAKIVANRAESSGMRIRRLRLNNFARRASEKAEIRLSEFFGPGHLLSNIKANFQLCSENAIKGFMRQVSLPGEFQNLVIEIGAKITVPVIEIINSNKNISLLFNLGNKGAICGLITDGKTTGKYGIYKHPELLARLVIATPKAFEHLNQNELLLRRLQDNLNLTGTICLQPLVKAGFFVTRFRINNQGPCRFFGIQFPGQREEDIFQSAINALEHDIENAAVAFYKAAGIECPDIKVLGRQEMRNLGKKVRVPFLNSTISSISLYDQPLDLIIGKGEIKIKLARRQLKHSY